MHAHETPDAQLLPSPTWCYGCGYNLAGLNPQGVCPECGLAIGAQARAHVEHVHFCLGLLIALAAALLLATACLVVAAAGVVINVWGQGSMGHFEDGEVAMVVGVWLAAMVLVSWVALMVVLSWALGRPLRGPARAEQKPRAHPTRSAIRFATGLAVLGLLVVWPGLLMRSGDAVIMGMLALALAAVVLAVSVVAICGDALDSGSQPRRPRWLAAVLACPFVVAPPVVLMTNSESLAGAWSLVGVALAMLASLVGMVWLASRAWLQVSRELQHLA